MSKRVLMDDEPLTKKKHTKLEVPAPNPQKFFFIACCVCVFLFALLIFGLVGGIYAIIYNLYLKDYTLCLIYTDNLTGAGVWGTLSIAEAEKKIQFKFFAGNISDIVTMYIGGPRSNDDPFFMDQFIPEPLESNSLIWTETGSYYEGTQKISRKKSKDFCQYFWRYSFIIETEESSIIIPLGEQCVSYVSWV